jgi:hypothetical protein
VRRNKEGRGEDARKSSRSEITKGRRGSDATGGRRQILRETGRRQHGSSTEGEDTGHRTQHRSQLDLRMILRPSLMYTCRTRDGKAVVKCGCGLNL